MNGINAFPRYDSTDGQPSPSGQAGQDRVNIHNRDNGRDDVNGIGRPHGVASYNSLFDEDGKDAQPGQNGMNSINGSPGEYGRDGSFYIDGSTSVPGQDSLLGNDGKDGPPSLPSNDSKDRINGHNSDNCHDDNDSLCGESCNNMQLDCNSIKGKQCSRGDRGPASSMSSSRHLDLTQPIPGLDQDRVYMVHINCSSMVGLGDGTGLLFSYIYSQFTV
jgi:hypothetical protein